MYATVAQGRKKKTPSLAVLIGSHKLSKIDRHQPNLGWLCLCKVEIETMLIMSSCPVCEVESIFHFPFFLFMLILVREIASLMWRPCNIRPILKNSNQLKFDIHFYVANSFEIIFYPTVQVHGFVAIMLPSVMSILQSEQRNFTPQRNGISTHVCKHARKKSINRTRKPSSYSDDWHSFYDPFQLWSKIKIKRANARNRNSITNNLFMFRSDCKDEDIMLKQQLKPTSTGRKL